MQTQWPEDDSQQICRVPARRGQLHVAVLSSSAMIRTEEIRSMVKLSLWPQRMIQRDVSNDQ